MGCTRQVDRCRPALFVLRTTWVVALIDKPHHLVNARDQVCTHSRRNHDADERPNSWALALRFSDRLGPKRSRDGGVARPALLKGPLQGLASRENKRTIPQGLTCKALPIAHCPLPSAQQLAPSASSHRAFAPRVIVTGLLEAGLSRHWQWAQSLC